MEEFKAMAKVIAAIKAGEDSEEFNLARATAARLRKLFQSIRPGLEETTHAELTGVGFHLARGLAPDMPQQEAV